MVAAMGKGAGALLCSIVFVMLPACGGGDKKTTEADTTAPAISQTDPSRDASGIAVNAGVSATFSEAMGPSSITASTFTLRGPSGLVEGVVSYSGTTATFSPKTSLENQAVYTASIADAAADTAGNRLPAGYTWSFTTGSGPDLIPPGVSSTAPAAGASGIAPNAAVSATFSEAMAAYTITGDNFSLSGPDGNVNGTLAYSSDTLTFTPAQQLRYGATYTASISSAVKDASGNHLPADFTWSFVTGPAPDSVRPRVIATSPAANASGIAVNSALSATFSEAMSANTLTTGSFTVTGPGGAIPGTVNYASNAVNFTPAQPLDYGASYTVTLTSVATDLAGNGLETFSWNFTTGPAPDTVAPEVAYTLPAHNAVADVTAQLKAVFTEDMDAGSLTTATVMVRDSANVGVPGAVTYDSTTRTVTFTPSASLAYSTRYTVRIETGAKDLAGNGLAAVYTWSVATAAQPDRTPPAVTAVSPVAGNAEVEPDAVLTAQFTEPLNGATLTNATFILSDGVNVLPGTVAYGGATPTGSTASFAPASRLASRTTYTATLTTGVTDSAGNPLASAYSWSFTTVRAWGIPVQLENSSSNVDTDARPESTIVVDGGGNVTVAWLQNDPIPVVLGGGTRRNAYANRFDATSRAWGTPTLIEADDNGDIASGSLRLAVGGDGTIVAAWVQYDGANSNAWTNRYANGAWGAAIRMNVPGIDVYYATVAMDSAGNAVAAWSQWALSSLDVYASHFEAATAAWSAPVPIESFNGNADSIRVAMDDAGNALAAWTNNGGPSGYAVMANRYDAAAAGWGTAGTLATSVPSMPTIALGVDANGDGVLLSSQPDAAGYSHLSAYHYSSALPGWGTPVALESYGGRATEPRLGMDANGSALAVWLQDDAVGLWSNRYDAAKGQWAGPVPIGGSVAMVGNLAVNGDGDAMLAYMTNAGVGAVRYHAATRQWQEPGAVEQLPGSDTMPEVALDDSGEATAVWRLHNGQYWALWANRYE